MLRSAWWTLRQPRYAALAAFMLVVALGCAGAGTWQISRFEQSVRDNDALVSNAHAGPVPLTAAVVPLAGSAPAPSADDIRFRTVTAAGSYLGGPPQFLRNQSLAGVNGYYVVTPLRTAGAVVLVARGFVAASDTGAPPAAVAAPPAGPVVITGRLQTASTHDDAASALGGGQLESINAAQQAGRLGDPVYDGYLTLEAGQPGTSGVSVLPDPDLSNPAGGAYEWQHFAYIIQWYLFALLALGAPFAIGRSEVRDAQRRFLGIDPGEQELGLGELDAGDSGMGNAGLGNAGQGELRGGAQVALRAGAELVEQRARYAQRWRRAARLAERYGRSIGVAPEGVDGVEDIEATDEPAQPRAARTEAGPTDGLGAPIGRDAVEGVGRVDGPGYRVANSALAPARSRDGYQGAYNDYLWELALADGNAPQLPQVDTVGTLPTAGTVGEPLVRPSDPTEASPAADPAADPAGEAAEAS